MSAPHPSRAVVLAAMAAALLAASPAGAALAPTRETTDVPVNLRNPFTEPPKTPGMAKEDDIPAESGAPLDPTKTEEKVNPIVEKLRGEPIKGVIEGTKRGTLVLLGKYVLAKGESLAVTADAAQGTVIVKEIADGFIHFEVTHEDTVEELMLQLP